MVGARDYWACSQDLWNVTTTRQGSLLIDLVGVKSGDLAWRLFLQQKILNVDSVWEKVNQEITKGFESYPPTEKEKEEKRKERAERPRKPQKTAVSVNLGHANRKPARYDPRG